ncbi:hypothetical protein NE237_026918 [Protea cynaroides]|uniref:Uncharacterized protein n=1 Tax=Protea cynaroides TaxID=273540 RepID=A0A9Q0JSH7_9MAGN|nr:hypothetical protein NE237_026918 [Protea cynaroides]
MSQQIQALDNDAKEQEGAIDNDAKEQEGATKGQPDMVIPRGLKKKERSPSAFEPPQLTALPEHSPQQLPPAAWSASQQLWLTSSPSSSESLSWTTSPHLSTPTSLDHVVFGIASSAKSWPQCKDYVSLWWKPHHVRGYVFLDTMPSGKAISSNALLPPICISEDTLQFCYTNKHGY